MGVFGAIRDVKNTLWLGAALFGYYFLLSSLVRSVLHADANAVWLLFIALLALYGLWTRAPIVALALTGTIVFLWVTAGLSRPGLSPDISPTDLNRTLVHALAPIVAVGLGVLARTFLLRKRRDPAPREAA